jgi:3-hydroxyacyl-CoA dehydrogenase
MREIAACAARRLCENAVMAEVKVARRGGVAVITIDNPPVNALATPVRAALLAAVREIAADPAVTAGVIATAGRTFIAGADLREMDRPLEEPQLPDVIRAIADCPKPLVAALHGAALGGGMEVALACRGRVAAKGTLLGFPEVKIGIVPGASGTQRLMRMIDFATAARMVTSGKPIGAAEALGLGLIDAIADGDVLEAAVAMAAGPDIGGTPPLAEIEARKVAPPAAAVVAELRAEVAKAARGDAAPMAALELMLQTAKVPFVKGVQEERAQFVFLRGSAEARALRRLFLAERDAGRLPELADVKPADIRAVGVVGGGLMGCGIAYAALAAGCRVVVAEGDPGAMLRGRARLAELMDGAVKSGRLAADKREAMGAALTWTIDLADFAPADLAIEAVFEDMAVKHGVMRRLEQAMRPDALIASNTSYLDLDAVGGVLADPGRFLGLHFFSPAHVMRLLEVVRGARTTPAALASGVAFGRRIGKIPIVTGVCEGFCGNRILKAYRIVAETMVEDGASPYEIDAAMLEFGFPMGPFAVQDMAGLEISYANRKLKPAMRADGRRLGVVEMLVDAGRIGRKAGKGWYRYPEGARAGEPDPEVLAMIEMRRIEQAIPHQHFPHDAIRAALTGAMRAEGEAILSEGIVARPEDVDLVLVHGYGFPARKGGPMSAG